VPRDARQLGYVANMNGDTVSVINLRTDTVTRTIGGFDYPWDAEISPNGALLYVPHANVFKPFNDHIEVVNLCKRKIVAEIAPSAFGQEYTSESVNGLYDYAPQNLSPTGTGAIKVIDTATARVIRTLDSPTDSSGALHTSTEVTSYDGSVLWEGVCIAAAPPCFAESIDGQTGQRIGNLIPVAGVPTYLQISPDGTKMLALGTFIGMASVIDLKTRTARNISTCPGPVTILTCYPGISDISPDGKTAWIGQYDGSIDVIDLTDDQLTQRLEPGGWILGVKFSLDGNRAYVSTTDPATIPYVQPPIMTVQGLLPGQLGNKGGFVKVYDAHTYQQLDEIATGNVPGKMAIATAVPTARRHGTRRRAPKHRTASHHTAHR
jgi:YVTN family beta-propeller protein